MLTRERIHRLVDDMSDETLARVADILERELGASSDVWDALLAAPVDDEVETETEAAAVDEAREDVRAGRVMGHREVLRQLAREA